MVSLHRPVLIAATMATLLVTTACHHDGGTSAANNASKAAPSTPQLGDFGFDVAGMDRSVAPGDDFFDYANGTWVKTTQIPEDRSSFNSFTSITVKTEQHSRDIIEGDAANDRVTGEDKQIGDYYAAYMDEAGIEAKGVSPVQPALDAIAQLEDKQALARTLGGQLRADVDLLNSTDFYTDRLFGLWVSQDLHHPQRYVPYLVQGGLGMPERSFYLDGGRMAQMREAYRAYIVNVLELAGIADAAPKAERILALETAIARVHASAEQTNNVQDGANAWAQADFARKAPGLDWGAFFEAAGLKAQRDFIVWQPQAVTGLSALVQSQPLQTWKDYLGFRALDRAAPYLSAVCRRALRLLWHHPGRHPTAAPALEAWHRRHQRRVGRSGGQALRAEIRQCADQDARRSDGQEHHCRLRQAHRRAGVDEPADQAARQGQDRRAHRGRGLPGHLARLQRARGTAR